METINLKSLSRAIETRDGATLGGFYADDAVLLIIDQLNPPNQPREIKGHAAVTEYFNDVCGRAMTHRVENGMNTVIAWHSIRCAATRMGRACFARPRSNSPGARLPGRSWCKPGTSKTGGPRG